MHTLLACSRGHSFSLQVVFTLHSSFANPSRELAEPPYEVTEHGWGEFDIVVEVGLSKMQACD